MQCNGIQCGICSVNRVLYVVVAVAGGVHGEYVTITIITIVIIVTGLAYMTCWGLSGRLARVEPLGQLKQACTCPPPQPI